MIEHTLDDHLIQVDMSFDLAFASIPETDQQLHKFGAAQGPQPHLPDHAFQFNQAEKGVPWDLHQMDHIVEAAQAKLTKEFEA
jgi:hypothetical protein